MSVAIQVAAKAIIVNSESKILLLREPSKNNLGSQHGLYGMAGGRLDPDEDFETALHREVFEETGLKVEPLFPVFVGEWYPVIKGQKTHIVGIFMVCKAKTSKVKLSEEHDDYKWVNPKEINKYKVMSPEPEAIKSYIKFRKLV